MCKIILAAILLVTSLIGNDEAGNVHKIKILQYIVILRIFIENETLFLFSLKMYNVLGSIRLIFDLTISENCNSLISNCFTHS